MRTIVSQIDLSTHKEHLGARIDFNNRDLATAVELSATATASTVSSAPRKLSGWCARGHES